jgi:hypothetical protein
MWEGDWTLRQDLAVEQRYNISAQVAKVSKRGIGFLFVMMYACVYLRGTQ